MACACCGADTPTTVFWADKEKGDIRRCQQCGLLYRSPRPRENLLTKYFADTWVEPAMRQEDCHRRNLQGIMARILPWQPSAGAILDIGSGYGHLLDQVPETWTRFGLDPSRRACQAARARLPQAQIRNGTIRNVPLPERFFDLITMIATVYFLPHPVRDLARARSLLKPDGVIAVHSPNFANRGYLYRLLNRDLPEIWVYFFSRKTLAKILQRAGFKVIADIDLHGFLANSEKVLNRLMARAEFRAAQFIKTASRKMIDLVPHFLLVAQPE